MTTVELAQLFEYCLQSLPPNSPRPNGIRLNPSDMHELGMLDGMSFQGKLLSSDISVEPGCFITELIADALTAPYAHGQEKLAREVRKAIESMDMFQRREFFQDIHEGYCESCGYKIPPGEQCHCTNDE